MKEYYSIGEAAKEVNTTSETLRHYDRIGLVKPSKKDDWTNYRYYTNQDIVRLNTVRALQQMDLPLQEIKKVLDYDNLSKIVNYLTKAEQKADQKIAELQNSKSKIALARANYEKKIHPQSENNDIFIQELPERTIMLSNLTKPTVDNLWNYHRHFYNTLPPEEQKYFSFEDLAGIYTENNQSQMFAICSKYIDKNNLKKLPAGKYLCCNCNEEEKEIKLNELLKLANQKYNSKPSFILEIIVISGVLKWNYQLQLLIKSK